MEDVIVRKIVYCILSAGILFVPEVALAGTYTYTTTQNPGAIQIVTKTAGGLAVGSYSTGTSVTMNSDGGKLSESYSCIGTTQPPHDSIFNSHIMCAVNGSSGSYTIIFGCNFLNQERTSQACVGGLYGKTGKYEGMGGTATWSGTDEGGMGTGQWQKMGG